MIAIASDNALYPDVAYLYAYEASYMCAQRRVTRMCKVGLNVLCSMCFICCAKGVKYLLYTL